MKKTSSFQAAAASTAAAIRNSAGASSLPMNASRQTGKPIEIDLADPRALDYRRDGDVDLFVCLEELYPSDPGQLTGASLRFSGCGKDGLLSAQIGDGHPITHCVGYLITEEMAWLAKQARSGENCMFRLHEMESADRDAFTRATTFSGATLIFLGGGDAKLHLNFGSHCLGVLTGRPLTAFLECMGRRGSGMEKAWR